MKTYKTTIIFGTGYRKSVEVRSYAKTRKGVMRAVGKYVANNFYTDVFEVKGLIVRDGVARNYSIGDWRTFGMTPAEERMVWKAAHDAIMG